VGTLALIRKFGITELEVGDLYGRKRPGFSTAAGRYGLADNLDDDSARPVGRTNSERCQRCTNSRSRVCGVFNDTASKHLTTQDCEKAIDEFNRWGRVLADSGLHLCYHTHGIEFGSSPDGTLFDTLVKRTDPKIVSYEMDIFLDGICPSGSCDVATPVPRSFPAHAREGYPQRHTAGRLARRCVGGSECSAGTGIGRRSGKPYVPPRQPERVTTTLRMRP